MRRRAIVRWVVAVVVLTGCDEPPTSMAAGGGAVGARATTETTGVPDAWPRCADDRWHGALAASVDRRLLAAVGDRGGRWRAVFAPIAERELALVVEPDSLAIAVVDRSAWLEAERASLLVRVDTAYRELPPSYDPAAFDALPVRATVRRIALAPGAAARIEQAMRAAGRAGTRGPGTAGPLVVRVAERGGRCRHFVSYAYADSAMPLAVLADSITRSAIGVDILAGDVTEFECRIGAPVRPTRPRR
jgi:hypothetical protein